MKNISWRWILILVVVVLACIYILPTFKPGTWPNKKINLGLDLQGGMHLLLEVDTEKAVENKIELIIEEMKQGMKQERIRHSGVEQTTQGSIEIRIRGDENLERFTKILDDNFSDLKELPESTIDDLHIITLDLPDSEKEYIKSGAVQQSLETIRNRVDEFGVSEPDIRRQGEDRILLQLPGLKDPERAKALIGKTAQLEFKIVDESMDPQTALSGNPPADSHILYRVEKNPETNRVVKKTPYLLKKTASLTGQYLVDARVRIANQFNEPYVTLKFDKTGARIFERITGENVGKRLAIVLDNTVFSAPIIKDRIGGGNAVIDNIGSMQEAKDLALVLRAGSLPAPVNFIEERTVKASLGQDSINKGLYSIYIGGILVIIFMLIYYKGAGMIADLALAMNILFIGAGLAYFGATLTLPGIAGVILTIGMAVDANVLIFERIREEIRLGKTPRAAVSAGFKRATLTILDANVTTLFAALILFQFGTGPVKGFAVTLSLGVISSLFTALILSRSIFDYLLINLKIKRISI